MFKTGISLFKQAAVCCKKMTTYFTLSDTCSEGTIFLIFKILVRKINLGDLSCLKQAPTCFQQGSACFISASTCLNQEGACFKTACY